MQYLWVDEKARSKGIGRKLMHEVERVAAKRGCVGIYLDTLSFQAPRFYEKLGYRKVGRIIGHPPGYSKYWFAKRVRI